MNKAPRLLIISYDAVGDELFSTLCSYKNFARLRAQSAARLSVRTVFLSNTYPIHASVATGVAPAAHGLINNTNPFPARHPKWHFEASRLKAKTLWQATAEKGLTAASVMWPVTAGAKQIRWNIPELMVLPGQSQLRENMKYGSKLLQARLFLRHRHLLQGISQPARDRFAAACMADILREKQPHLALMHLTAYDSLCHEHGLGAPALTAALDALDENLGLLMDAAGGEYHILLFSDHSQLPAQNPLLPNGVLVKLGHLSQNADGDFIQKQSACYFECSGGSAFLHPGSLSPGDIDEIRRQVAALPGFGRFLTPEEMAECGRPRLPFGFAAAPGWACEAYATGEKANHGYPANYTHYSVFYMGSGPGFAPGTLARGGSLLDIAPTAAAILGLSMPQLPPADPAFYGGATPAPTAG